MARKTAVALKEVATLVTMQRARKPYWFEKFVWCISSDNYLIVGGRDRQQNDIIIRRILRQGILFISLFLFAFLSFFHAVVPE